jgi:D-3-phosphoglycerate dehydrogenase
MTLGIIGFGRIGSILGSYAIPIFKSVLVHDINPDSLKMSEMGLSNGTLQEVLENSDLVSLHTTPNESGSPVIGRTELGYMKDGSMLINTARGSLVDEALVAKEIQSGRLAGYACDVLSGEPFSGNEITKNPIWQTAKLGYNVIISPHIGGCTKDAMELTELYLAQYVAKKVLGHD